MRKRFFEVEGFELVERNVAQYAGSSSRVLVPKTWKKVAVVRIE